MKLTSSIPNPVFHFEQLGDSYDVFCSKGYDRASLFDPDIRPPSNQLAQNSASDWLE